MTFLKKNTLAGFYKNCASYLLLSNLTLAAYWGLKLQLDAHVDHWSPTERKLVLMAGSLGMSMLLYFPLAVKNLCLADSLCHKKDFVRGPKESLIALSTRIVSNQTLWANRQKRTR